MIRLMALLPCLCLLGCQRDRELLPQGNATHASQPIPLGMILFLPDPAKNPKGKPGSAEIRNGRFQCQPGQGISPGHYNLHVTGGNGVKPEPFSPFGKLLFDEYVTAMEINSDTSAVSLEIPPKPKR